MLSRKQNGHHTDDNFIHTCMYVHTPAINTVSGDVQQEILCYGKWQLCEEQRYDSLHTARMFISYQQKQYKRWRGQFHMCETIIGLLKVGGRTVGHIAILAPQNFNFWIRMLKFCIEGIFFLRRIQILNRNMN